MSEKNLNLEELILEAFKQSKLLGVLLGVMFDGGRIVSTSAFLNNLIESQTQKINFELRELNLVQDFHKYSAQDLIVIDNASEEALWKINQHCEAQLILISAAKVDSTLVDYSFSEQELKAAVQVLEQWIEKAEALSERWAFDGPQENQALLLDRDGVLIEDVDYVTSAQQVRMRPDIMSSLRKAREQNFRLLVFTNQSGIGRGKIALSQYEQVTLHLQDLLAKEGLFLDRILKAPFFEDSSLLSCRIRKSLRKPRPGMIHQLAREFRLDLKKSKLVGDCATDLMAGALAGVGSLYLIKGPRKTESEKWKQWPLQSRIKAQSKMQEIDTLDQIFR